MKLHCPSYLRLGAAHVGAAGKGTLVGVGLLPRRGGRAAGAAGAAGGFFLGRYKPDLHLYRAGLCAPCKWWP